MAIKSIDRSITTKIHSPAKGTSRRSSRIDTMKKSLSKTMFRHIDAIDHHSIMVMLSLEGGICVYSLELDNVENTDPQLLSGALTAISNLTGEILKMEDPIGKMTINDLSIFISRVNDVIIYYMFKGDEEESIDRLANFIIRMNKRRYWKRIANNECGISKRLYNLVDKIAVEIFAN